MCSCRGLPPRRFDGLQRTAHVDGAKVEEVDSVANQENDFLVIRQLVCGVRWSAGQEAAGSPDEHDGEDVGPLRDR